MKYTKTLLMIVVILSSVASIVKAESPQLNGIVFTPALFEFKLDPGTEVEFNVKLTNLSEEERTYEIHTQPFGSNNTDGTPLFEEDLQSEMTNWILLPFDTVTVLAGESHDVTMKIQVPTIASPGSYQSAVLFREFDSGLREERSGNAIIAQTGPLIFLDVTGGAFASADFSEFNPSEVVSEFLFPDLVAEFRNTGSVTLVPKGVINVDLKYGFDSQESYSFSFNPNQEKTLRNSRRTYTTEFPQDGQLRIGIYDAELTVAYGKDNKITSTITRFIIFPWKVALVVLAVLTIFMILLLRKRGKVLK